ncbi:MAG TPA: DHHA1 domain-containing protein, partial [Ktedonobacterales bacterium]|nr:DHHA1 domain-containing protein [Ktedonobacterales bacterium]
ERLRTKPDDVLTRVDQFQEELADARRELAAAQRAQARELADQLAGKAVRVGATGDTPVVAAVVSVTDDQALRELSDTVRAKLGPSVVALIMTSGEQARFVVMVAPELTARGVDARAIAANLGARLGGRGGGKPELAQGGGKQADAARSAAEAVPELVREQLG